MGDDKDIKSYVSKVSLPHVYFMTIYGVSSMPTYQSTNSSTLVEEGDVFCPGATGSHRQLLRCCL